MFCFQRSFTRGGKQNFCEDLRSTIHKKHLIGAIEGKPSDLAKRIQSMMVKEGNYWADELVLLSDGAPWIENIFQSLFPNSLMILDWYHAVENVRKCASDLFKEDSDKYHFWVKKYKEMLWNGDVEELLESLLEEAKASSKQTPYRKLYAYFNSRKERIRYKEFREKDYLIGSGAVESANSYSIQGRLKRSRMK